MANQWFRMYSEFAGDPVIQSLAFEDQRHYIVLLCLKNDGVLDRDIPANRRELIINRGLGLDPATASEVKRRLMEVNLIDKSWQILGWNKRQFVSDNVTERTRKHRNKLKTGNVSETLQERSGNAPEQNRTETEQKQKNIGRSRAFIPPTIGEVIAYCLSRGNGVDPQRFHDHYTANGWMVGKTRMKNWQAAVRTWEKDDKPQLVRDYL